MLADRREIVEIGRIKPKPKKPAAAAACLARRFMSQLEDDISM
jgi:hypothetical protein